MISLSWGKTWTSKGVSVIYISWFYAGDAYIVADLQSATFSLFFFID